MTVGTQEVSRRRIAKRTNRAHPLRPHTNLIDGARVVDEVQQPSGRSELDTGHALLRVSGDGGATFRVLSIPDEATRQYPPAICAAPGKVFVLGANVSGTITPLRARPGFLREVDLTTAYAMTRFPCGSNIHIGRNDERREVVPRAASLGQ